MKSLELKLKTNEITQESYDETLMNYEGGINGEGRRAMRTASALCGTRRQVSASSGRTLAVAKNLGVFWPAELWNSNAERLGQPKADKKELQKLPATDGTVTGVTRDKAFGEPPGTYTLAEELPNKSEHVACVADSKYQGGEELDADRTALKKR
eukprot:815690-Pyramimonas_sp.AAC.1